MNEIEKEQLRVEIQHIFDSGANEIRIFEMVESFIESRNGVNKLPIHGVSISLARAEKYGRHQHFLGTQQKQLVEIEDWRQD